MKKVSIKLKIIMQSLVFFFFTIIILAISFAFLRNMYSRNILDYQIKINMQIEQQLKNDIDMLIRVAQSTGYNKLIQSTLTEKDFIGQINNSKNVQALLSNITIMNDNVYASIYDLTGKNYRGSYTPAFSSFSLINYRYEQRAKSSTTYFFTDLIMDDTGKYSLSIIQPIFDYSVENESSNSLLGYCIVMMNMGNTLQLVNNLATDNHEALLVFDKSGSSFGYKNDNYSPDKAQGAIEYDILNGMFTIKSVILQNNWFKENQYLYMLFIVTFSLITLLMIGMSFSLFRSVINPMLKIVSLLKNIPYENRKITLNYNNEYGLLIASINDMLSQIENKNKELIQSNKKNFQAEYAKQQMQLLAYQTQINPHFLYNTLDTIRGIAMYHNVPVINEVITSLSNIMRYSIGREDDVPFLEEWKMMENFLSIIRIRFNNRFEYNLYYDKQISEWRIIRMILQPLVENAIYHGLEPIDENPKLTVKCTAVDDNILYIQVQDNGKGMSEQRLEQIKDVLNRQDVVHDVNYENMGIALINIDRRLKIRYGDSSGLIVESLPNVGTTISLKIPIKAQTKEQ